jgi:hypothetical protein
MSQILDLLRPGDVLTHAYSGAPNIAGDFTNIVQDGKLLPAALEAKRRGVIFDVGHGGGSFVFRNAVPAIEQGFYPDSISTDLHGGSMNAGMQDMPTTMSKFLAMGEPLVEVIRESTINPATEIQHPELGHLTDVVLERRRVPPLGETLIREVRGLAERDPDTFDGGHLEDLERRLPRRLTPRQPAADDVDHLGTGDHRG